MSSFTMRTGRSKLAVLLILSALHSPPEALSADAVEAVAPVAAQGVSRAAAVLLKSRCVQCHGGVKRAGGFSLVFRAETLQAADSGKPVIVPGKPSESELIQRVTAQDGGEPMPPNGSRLTADEVATLSRWIQDGAEYADHWAYTDVKRWSLPDVSEATWASRPLDVYVLAKLEQSAMRPAPVAGRTVLIRRTTFDLIGLPATVDEVDSFLADDRPDAYQRVVDRLLASPRFGERWASVWLDLARYADTQGYEEDLHREIWRYRDWVIDALNRDMPFDQFTIEQLAGDLLPNPSLDQLIATAFHRNTLTNNEAGTDNEQFRVAAVIDRVNTTWEVWLATTMACVQCHSHPYDPFRQLEYYESMAFFNNTEDADENDDRPRVDSPNWQQRQQLEKLDRELVAEQARLESVPQEERPSIAARITALANEIRDFEVSTTPILRELSPGKRRTTRRFIRGDWLNQAETVEPDVPAALPPLNPNARQDRLGLARWLTSDRHPLTSRVAVNRFWKHLFGTGLVATLEDFGTLAEPPSHPALLDDLAVSFLDDFQWSVKRLLKEIVLSSTYRQSSLHPSGEDSRDPLNRLLSRGPRFRLTAEQVRDQALAASGLLSDQLYGPSVFPPRPPEIRATYGDNKWQPSTGEQRYRRSLYTYTWRTSPYPSAMIFDAPSREFCVSRRIQTNTPLQALVMLNDPVFLEAAHQLGLRMMREAGPDTTARLTHGFRLVLARRPSEHELSRLQLLYDRSRRRLASHSDSSAAPTAMTVVAHVLLNLDESMSKN